MKFSTIAATSIIAASTAVSGNEVTNLCKLETTTSESGNKFRKLDDCFHILVCDGGSRDCYEDNLYGCTGNDCPKYEICAKCDGGAGIAFNFEIGEAGISAGLVLASDDGEFDFSVDPGNSFCATAFLVIAGESGAKEITWESNDPLGPI